MMETVSYNMSVVRVKVTVEQPLYQKQIYSKLRVLVKYQFIN